MTIPSLCRISLLVLWATAGTYAQVPVAIGTQGVPAKPDPIRGTCNDAGTVSLSLSPGSQSGDPLFLCFGDALQITHNGDADLSGDPDPSTPAGIGYAIYSCAPTVSGMTLGSILTDPCILKTPPSPSGLWVSTGSQPNGNTSFTNDGFLQDFFNGGNPVRIWFAPITVDNFATNTFEEAAPGTGAGPCVDVNTSAAFSVVYLTPLEISGLDVSSYGTSPATGSFTIRGGKPEFDGSTYTIVIYQKSDPGVLGTVTSGPTTHGGQVTFEVPNDKEFVVEVKDGTGCATTFIVTVPSLVVEIGCTEVVDGSTSCVDVLVRNYQSVESLQLFFHWDPAIVQFASITSPGLPNFQPSAQAILNGDSVLSIGHFAFPGQSIPEGDILFTLCFESKGPVGSCSPIFIKTRYDGAKNEAIIGLGGGNDAQLAISSLPGCLCVVESGPVKVTLTPTPITCAGKNDGKLQLEVVGGTAPFNFNWAHATNSNVKGNGVLAFNPSTLQLDNLIPGIYSVTITDSSVPPVQEIRSVNISTPAPLGITLDAQSPTCFSDSDGFILATLQGGTAPFSFKWSNGLEGIGEDLVDGLSSGGYGLTVTDANGCTATASQNLLTQELQVTLLSKQDVACNGTGVNGSINIQISGGTLSAGSNYQIAWTPGGSGTSLSNLPAGTYAVTVTDDRGCSDTLSVTITAPASPQIVTLQTTVAPCTDKPGGSINAVVLAAPGAPNLTYSWSGPAGSSFSGQQITNLLPGSYSLTVLDNNGCADIDTVTVGTKPPIAALDTLFTRPTCPGDSNGSIGLQMAGGTSPYSFLWSNIGTPSPNSVNPAIMAGNYLVSVTDAAGCGPLVLSLTLEDRPAITVTLVGIDSVSCDQGICDGKATATGGYSDGATGNFTFSWGSGSLDFLVPASTASDLCKGKQTLTVSDGNCAIDTFVLVPGPAPIQVEATVTDVSCFGKADGQIAAQVIGGNPGFRYIWAAGDTTANALRQNLIPGFYQITVVDQEGCVGTSLVVDVRQPEIFRLSVDTTITRNPRCAGESNGVIAVLWEGGNNGSPVFSWDPSGNSGSSGLNLTAGSYGITATDSRGCKDSVRINLVTPPAITAVIPFLEEPLCHGESTPLTVSSASGGNGGPFTFSVDNGLAQSVGTPVPVFADQAILVSVFDSRGCRRDTTISIGQPPKLLLDLGPEQEIELGDSILLGPLNDLSGFDLTGYAWSPSTWLDCDVCENVLARPEVRTTYTLRITDLNGCTVEDAVTVNVRTIRRVFIPEAFSPNFDGFNDVFTIYTGRGVERITSIRIFDRWGNQIHEAFEQLPDYDGSIAVWDGHYRGRLMDPGVFVYAVEARFLDGRVLVYRGEIQIVR